jgi:hypothetical protein
MVPWIDLLSEIPIDDCRLWLDRGPREDWTWNEWAWGATLLCWGIRSKCPILSSGGSLLFPIILPASMLHGVGVSSLTGPLLTLYCSMRCFILALIYRSFFLALNTSLISRMQKIQSIDSQIVKIKKCARCYYHSWGNTLQKCTWMAKFAMKITIEAKRRINHVTIRVTW